MKSPEISERIFQFTFELNLKTLRLEKKIIQNDPLPSI